MTAALRIDRTDDAWPEHVIDEYRHLRSFGKTPERAAADLGYTVDGIRKIINRHGNGDHL